MSTVAVQAQQKKISTRVFDGIIVAGYTDNGAYINCTGPGVKYIAPKWNLMLGLLPSIKIKEDTSDVKNAMFTPALGFGATLTIFKHLTLQIPTFYTPKTNTNNGRWTLGAGLGYKI
ncbi:hypothetical protein C5749_10785 [Sphingobacterium gobiense]|uniref:Outer membrane protein beta-barrel domain-containing protein n=1 Tax=Sphingobacterium gobiense TaxID=1382456 RepID=A0A2S9JNN5_9SPHI|nr:hypothetical protein C5749_10785 [Sphingobacterium gobiense]